MDITIRPRQPLPIPKPVGALSMKHSSASLIAIGFRSTPTVEGWASSSPLPSSIIPRSSLSLTRLDKASFEA